MAPILRTQTHSSSDKLGVGVGVGGGGDDKMKVGYGPPIYCMMTPINGQSICSDIFIR